LLPPSEQVDLVRESEALEAATTDQLVVVTEPTLDGRDIANYGSALGNQMGLGQADKDNGVLLLVAPKEHKVRIAVGYGLEGLLTDQRAAKIVNDMLPYFRAGDGSQAVRVGVSEIDGVLRSDRRRPQYLKKAA
jgi:uncharacterized protein